MIKLETNQFAIRSIICSNLDCEWGEVKVTLDEAIVYPKLKKLYNEVAFVDELDETFKAIDEVRVSGKLNMIYDPDYSFRVKLYYSAAKEMYSFQIEL